METVVLVCEECGITSTLEYDNYRVGGEELLPEFCPFCANPIEIGD